ncbi:hypothetical protein NDU88_003969 [Pleurodeles waltl]|uniref:Uncharacterized protein n=1 Tax=Pleurodeles waltl TaxID=8319 RepID=A0AAV7PB37_PLEWA|nr:hypothetical protein NDU88_003969 [Pleurodeles waltl]
MSLPGQQTRQEGPQEQEPRRRSRRQSKRPRMQNQSLKPEATYYEGETGQASSPGPPGRILVLLVETTNKSSCLNALLRLKKREFAKALELEVADKGSKLLPYLCDTVKAAL